jgi:sodium/bile acid cotransporter 7
VKLLRRLHIDPFILAIVTAAVTGTLLPAEGWGVPTVDWLSNITVFALFYLFGARLSPAETLSGLKNWRLHLLILSFTFIMFPILGQLMSLAFGWLLPHGLIMGIVYISILPSTVQSSIAFTSIAKGNVPAAIVSASTSNILGVFLTPALAALLMQSQNFVVTPESILEIGLQIFLPFVLGQVTRRWTGKWIEAHPQTKIVDRGTIVIVVYSAFSSAKRENIWAQVNWWEIALVLAIALTMLGIMLFATWITPKKLGFPRGDVIAIQFCGTKKSLATGLPMASVLFSGTPVGLLILPLVLFHQAQLMACATLADRYSKQVEDTANESE